MTIFSYPSSSNYLCSEADYVKPCSRIFFYVNRENYYPTSAMVAAGCDICFDATAYFITSEIAWGSLSLEMSLQAMLTSMAIFS